MSKPTVGEFFGSLFIVSVLLFSLFMLAHSSRRERMEWDVFRVAHRCKAVAKIPGEFMPIYGGGSTGMTLAAVTSTSAKTGWLCDDGVTYYKEN